MRVWVVFSLAPDSLCKLEVREQGCPPNASLHGQPGVLTGARLGVGKLRGMLWGALEGASLAGNGVGAWAGSAPYDMTPCPACCRGSLVPSRSS